MTLGQRIRDLREKSNLTQKELASILGMESAAVSKYELDMREPNISTLLYMAEIFNVSMDYLLGRGSGIFANPKEKTKLDMTLYKEKYEKLDKMISEGKLEIYNDEAMQEVATSLYCGAGAVSYGMSYPHSEIHLDRIKGILDNIEKCREPIPQLYLELRNFEDGIGIIEMDSEATQDLPFNAKDRIELYSAKLSKQYNVLALAFNVDNNGRCKLISAISQKKGEDNYLPLHMPRTTLPIHEYLEIWKEVW